ncbi:MAG: DNA repair protein RecO [Bacteroidales bacterium]
MYVKTRAVVLNHIKYTDSRIIARLLTPDFGKISIITSTGRSKKSPGKSIYFQPLFLLDIELNFREKKEIQQIRDLRMAENPGLPDPTPHKQSIAIFLADVLQRSIKENEPDESLFQFVWHAVRMFEHSDKSSVNFHLYFLSHLMKYLGFAPGNKWSHDYPLLDTDSGKFVNNRQLNSACLTERESMIIDKFTNIAADEIPHGGFSNQDRQLGLNALMSYYERHLPDFGKLKSFQILKEIYH